MKRFVAAGVAALGVAAWVVGYRESGVAAVVWQIDAESLAVVSGMLIVGVCAALVTGGLLGLGRPLAWLGAVAAVPFAAMVALFAMVSSSGGCRDDAGLCSVSGVQRFGAWQSSGCVAQ